MDEVECCAGLLPVEKKKKQRCSVEGKGVAVLRWQV
jgi:hypothetical protein